MKCFYVPGEVGIIDYLNASGGTWGGRTLEQVRMENPGVKIGDIDEVIEQFEDSFCSPPKRIDEEAFMYAMEVLPPCAWVNTGYTESFHVSELIYGCVGDIYARIGRDYYHLSARLPMSHAAIIRACAEA